MGTSCCGTCAAERHSLATDRSVYSCADKSVYSDDGNMQKQSAPDARERILKAADTLFYSRGIRATGIDEIIAVAGVAKASLYKHFVTKDALIAAYVSRRDELWREDFERRLRDGDCSPRERLLRVFDLLQKWFRTKAFRGCAFINASVELADSRHAGHRAA